MIRKLTLATQLEPAAERSLAYKPAQWRRWRTTSIPMIRAGCPGSGQAGWSLVRMNRHPTSVNCPRLSSSEGSMQWSDHSQPGDDEREDATRAEPAISGDLWAAALLAANQRLQVERTGWRG